MSNSDHCEPFKSTYKGQSVLKILPPEIFYEIFDEDVILPRDRLAFGLTCRYARQLLVAWRGGSHSVVAEIPRIRLGPLKMEFNDESSSEMKLYELFKCLRYDDTEMEIFENSIEHLCKEYTDNVGEQLFELEFGTANCDLQISNLKLMLYFDWIKFKLNLYELWWDVQPKSMHDGRMDWGIRVGQLLLLTVTFSMQPWMFLDVQTERTCIACPHIISAGKKTIHCRDIHEMDGRDMIDGFFTCTEYPRCYEPRTDACRDTFFGRLELGDTPDVGMMMCRFYWECQRNVKLWKKNNQRWTVTTWN